MSEFDGDTLNGTETFGRIKFYNSVATLTTGTFGSARVLNLHQDWRGCVRIF